MGEKFLFPVDALFRVQLEYFKDVKSYHSVITWLHFDVLLLLLFPKGIRERATQHVCNKSDQQVYYNII